MKVANVLHKRFLLLLKIFLILLFITHTSVAQIFAPKNYPRNYFRWPVLAQPGIVANMGELRSNHYHMGLDCRTNQKQNIPVVAAADGYIAKIKIEPFGFGRAVYINHPDGLTTLYAHLNDFAPPLERYVTEQQYKLKQWNIFIDIPAGLFTVKKGDFIAYSGNTGGSEGPHLHFEIRETGTDKNLNPSLFNFPIPDTIPPVITRLAIYNRYISTFEQTPQFIPIKKQNGYYITAGTILKLKYSKISFGITAADRNNLSSNLNGIYEAALYADEKLACAFQIDKIGYDETRYLNANIDYKWMKSGGGFVQHLSRLPGYPQGLYKSIKGDGVLEFADTLVHNIRIEVKDANGNLSSMCFTIKADSATNTKMQPIAKTSALFHPASVNVFERSGLLLYMPETCLYDSIRFRYSELISSTGFSKYWLHDCNVPVHDYFKVSIKAGEAFSSKMMMGNTCNGKNNFEKTVYANGWHSAWFREFGSCQLMIDTLPPIVSPVGFNKKLDFKKASRIAFTVADNCGEIASVNVTLDGQWLRFTYDKGRTFSYTFDERCPPGEHELRIKAVDVVGNTAEKVYCILR